MKKVRIYITTAALALCCGIQAQGVRNSVCIVYPQYNQADSTLLAAYADAYNRAGLSSRADALDSYAEGTFGSGVVIEKDGQLYVLTNRHVAGYASEAKIVFQVRPKTQSFEHCPVYSSCMDADLAIIQLPATAGTVCQPMTIDETPVTEGEDITAVGFPGLGGKASWQLTRGTVSNSSLDIEEDEVRYIQHTAPIDPGSSGGPLLRKKGDVYSLIGINTQKAFYRDRVGIAIGVTYVQAFLQTLDTPNTSDRQVLQALRPYDAKRWHEYYAQMPQAKRDSIKKDHYILPLDFALAVYEAHNVSPLSDGEVVEAKLKNDHFGIDRDVDQHFQVLVGYDHFFNGYHNFAVAYDIHARYLYQDIRLVAPLYMGATDTVSGIMAGYGLGAQLPMRFDRKNKLIPHAMVGAQVGGFITPNQWHKFHFGMAFNLRAGVDYRFVMDKVAICVGAEYVMEILFGDVTFPLPQLPGKFSSYMVNGLGVKVGVGF